MLRVGRDHVVDICVVEYYFVLHNCVAHCACLFLVVWFFWLDDLCGFVWTSTERRNRTSKGKEQIQSYKLHYIGLFFSEIVFQIHIENG